MNIALRGSYMHLNEDTTKTFLTLHASDGKAPDDAMQDLNAPSQGRAWEKGDTRSGFHRCDEFFYSF